MLRFGSWRAKNCATTTWLETFPPQAAAKGIFSPRASTARAYQYDARNTLLGPCNNNACLALAKQWNVSQKTNGKTSNFGEFENGKETEITVDSGAEENVCPKWYPREAPKSLQRYALYPLPRFPHEENLYQC